MNEHSLKVDIEKLKALATKAAQPVGNMAAHDVVVRQFTTRMEFRNAFSPDLILKLIASHEALTALAPKEQQAQEPDGYLDKFNVFYPERVAGFDLRPIYFAQQAQAGEAELVTLDSALEAIEHVGQHNGPGREAEARRMLVHTTLQPQPQAVDERESFEKWVSASGRAHMLERDARHGWYIELNVTAWFAGWMGRASLAQPTPVAAEQEPWIPYLSDRADGCKGRYAIARWNPAGYREVWNLHKHKWAAFSDDVLTLEQAQELMRNLVIPTAHPAAVQRDEQERDAAQYITGRLQSAINGKESYEFAQVSVANIAAAISAMKTAKADHSDDMNDAVLCSIATASEQEASDMLEEMDVLKAEQKDHIADARKMVIAERQADAGYTPVRNDVLQFLHGAGPLEGIWYGEAHPERKGMYWWRRLLPNAGERPPVPTQQGLTDERIIRIFYPMTAPTETQRHLALSIGRAIESALQSPQAGEQEAKPEQEPK
jgi:hypothetical protein